jgi:hypothetical protein
MNEKKLKITSNYSSWYFITGTIVAYLFVGDFFQFEILNVRLLILQI